MQVSEIRQRLRGLGAGPAHEARVLRLWARALPQTSGRRPLASFLPQALRKALPAIEDELAGLARLRSQHAAADGSARLLVQLLDGQTVEAVLLPRDGLCVSTPGRLRGGLPVLHDRPGWPRAPTRQRRDRGPGGAGAARCGR